MRRRYTDFVFLHNTLYKEYPAVAVPPLPEKHNITYARGASLSPDFMMRRAHSLHRFLKRITLHPELRRSSILIQVRTLSYHTNFQDTNMYMQSSSNPPNGTPP